MPYRGRLRYHGTPLYRQYPKARQRSQICAGKRKPLKKLDSDKRIQGNPSLFSMIFLAGFGWTLLDLAKFGIPLGGPVI
jgi:hypothetical protein